MSQFLTKQPIPEGDQPEGWQRAVRIPDHLHDVSELRMISMEQSLSVCIIKIFLGHAVHVVETEIFHLRLQEVLFGGPPGDNVRYF